MVAPHDSEVIIFSDGSYGQTCDPIELMRVDSFYLYYSSVIFSIKLSFRVCGISANDRSLFIHDSMSVCFESIIDRGVKGEVFFS